MSTRIPCGGRELIRSGEVASYLVMAFIFVLSIQARAGIAEILQSEGYTRCELIESPARDELFVTASVNGNHCIFLVDTGSAYTQVSRAAAQRLGLAVDRLILGSGLNGTVKSEVAKVDSLKIGEIALVPSTVLIAENAANTNKNSGVQCDGLVGLETMRKNHFIIQAGQPATLYFKTQGETGDETQLDPYLTSHGLTSISLLFRSHHFIVPVTLNGVATEMILDTGASRTVLGRDFVTEHQFQTTSVRGQHMNGLDGQTEQVSEVPHCTILAGSYVFHPLAVLVGNLAALRQVDPHSGLHTSGLLGYDLLAKFNFILNTEINSLYLN